MADGLGPTLAAATRAAYAGCMYSYELRLVPRLHDERAWTDDDRAAVAAHAERLAQLRDQGIVVLAGRTDAANPDTRGIVIFEAADEEAARVLMRTDPAVASGVMTATLAKFRLAVEPTAPRTPPNAAANADEPALVCRLDAATFIAPPRHLPWLLRPVLALAEKVIGGKLAGLRALAHYPKTLVGAGLLEAFICHKDRAASPRLLALVRLAVSYAASCPFCVDLNGANFRKFGIVEEELAALRGERDIEGVPSLREAERAAIAYARAVSETPVRVSDDQAERLIAAVGERGFAIVVSTAAQVNFWARLLQGMGAPPAFIALEAPPLALERTANPRRR